MCDFGWVLVLCHLYSLKHHSPFTSHKRCWLWRGCGSHLVRGRAWTLVLEQTWVQVLAPPPPFDQKLITLLSLSFPVCKLGEVVPMSQEGRKGRCGSTCLAHSSSSTGGPGVWSVPLPAAGPTFQAWVCPSSTPAINLTFELDSGSVLMFTLTQLPKIRYLSWVGGAG